jgi:hypothetical protein
MEAAWNPGASFDPSDLVSVRYSDNRRGNDLAGDAIIRVWIHDGRLDERRLD